MDKKQGETQGGAEEAIAAAFVGARLEARALPTYPGPAPSSLDAAYRIQDEAIRAWPDALAGWKVGRITGAAQIRFGTDRLAGPIFRDFIARAAAGEAASAKVFEGGFAAVEGEFVIMLGADAPAEKTGWTTEEAADMIGAVRVGIEIASSPFPGVNELGPLVTISDFGNNAGLILGPELPRWREFDLSKWRCETFIDGESVGANTAAAIPGGPVESLRFLLEVAARRGLPLKEGMAVSTGAVTGVHDVRIGQAARMVFTGGLELSCVVDRAVGDARAAAAKASA